MLQTKIKDLKQALDLKQQAIINLLKDIQELKTEADTILADYILLTDCVLTPRHKDFLAMALGLGEYRRKHTRKEIAKKYGISQSRAHEIIKKAMENIEAFVIKSVGEK